MESYKRLKGSDISTSFDNIKISHLNIILGNFNFRTLSKILDVTNIDIYKKINIIISASKSKEIEYFYKEFDTYDKKEKEEVLIDNFFKDISYISNDSFNKVKQLIAKENLEIKLGFNKENEIYSNDEILIGDHLSISGNFLEEELINSNEYYHILINREFLRADKLFNHKFESCFPFYSKKEDKEDSLSLLPSDDIFDIDFFNLNELIVDLVEKEEIKRIKEDINTKEVEEEIITPHKYQEKAIDELVTSDFNGILEMATGTGKTFTTLLGLKKYLENKKEIITIVVPYKMLLEQWKESINKVFGSNDISVKENYKIIECYSDNKEWKEDLFGIERHYKKNYDYVFAIFVLDSFRIHMQSKENIEWFSKVKPMLIVDEAHNLNKKDLNKISNIDIFKSKLAISATLYDEYDEELNKKINEYFRGIHYVYSLKEAIDNNFLTKYDYYPKAVDLKSEEVESYKEIVRKIDILKVEKKFNKEFYELKRQEGELLSKAYAKIEVFKEDFLNLEEKDLSIVYCNLGKVGDVKYIDYITSAIKDLGYMAGKINAEVSMKTRKELINNFSNRETSVLTAVKCLDEGVDIPATRNAFLLYSGGKSKEYIQRRGRVLRKSKGKEKAFIYDYVVRVDGEFPNREIKRFNEYNSLAINKEKNDKFIEENSGK